MRQAATSKENMNSSAVGTANSHINITTTNSDTTNTDSTAISSVNSTNNAPNNNINNNITTTTSNTDSGGTKTSSINTTAKINGGSGYNYMGPPATPSVPVDENRKPKHLSQWTNADVIKWLKRHCEHFYEQYGELFLEHEITGRSLCRVTDNMLERMGIELQEHRDELRRIIMKLKLKSDMVKLKDLERS